MKWFQSAPSLSTVRSQYRIFDIFTFFNELELLEIRLNILDPYVNNFVIIESTETFSGQPKPLVFQEHRDQFQKFDHKIIHYVVQDTPRGRTDLQARLARPGLSALDREIINLTLTSDAIPPGDSHWLKEFYQKESIRKALTELRDDDLCLVSDVDEIWNPNIRIDLTRNAVLKLRQIVYGYYLNNRSNEPWAGTLVTRYKNMKHASLNHLRNANKTNYVYVKNGGWHFTNQGGANRIKDKVEASYGPEDYNNDEVKLKIRERMAENKDYIGRKFKYRIDEASLPAYLQEHRSRYQAMFKSHP